MAIMVPIGMDFCGSAKSPERLEPAIMPEKSMLFCELKLLEASSGNASFAANLFSNQMLDKA